MPPIDMTIGTKVVNLCTGPGWWANAMSIVHPNVEVIGIDSWASEEFRERPNCRFQLGDLNQPWEMPSNTSDFIFASQLGWVARQWNILLHDIHNHLAPGGWLEIHDWSDLHDLTQRTTWDIEMTEPNDGYETHLKAAGFVNIKVYRRKTSRSIRLWHHIWFYIKACLRCYYLEDARLHLVRQILRQSASKDVDAKAWADHWKGVAPFAGEDLRFFIQYALLVSDIRSHAQRRYHAAVCLCAPCSTNNLMENGNFDFPFDKPGGGGNEHSTAYGHAARLGELHVGELHGSGPDALGLGGEMHKNAVRNCEATMKHPEPPGTL
ncbi:S-adenosyl-L-methionine-dependent methyltransferase [Lasiosphaeria ovina]|uniref:S-adenosyl-L-methionine-dependent methyltransferase n=1 Tax=Lasiosphaeria ovina TaxID=92902 RepID=A0AAE0JVV0_9PEZI|nr:S-adenosyl-L-methionine-dependent methyltransferase [Lasiosphaeria ovina]